MKYRIYNLIRNTLDFQSKQVHIGFIYLETKYKDSLILFFTDNLQARGQENLKFRNIQTSLKLQKKCYGNFQNSLQISTYFQQTYFGNIYRNVLRAELTKSFFVVTSTESLRLNAYKFGADDQLPLIFHKAHGKL